MRYQVTLTIAGVSLVIQTEQAALLPPLHERFGPFVQEGRRAESPAVTLTLSQRLDRERVMSRQELRVEPSAAAAFGLPLEVVPSRQVVRRDGDAMEISAAIYEGIWNGNAAAEVTLFTEYVAEPLEGFLLAFLPDVLLRHRCCLMHASGLVSRERAYLFTGPSGAGKTTVVVHSPGRVVLSDELVAVELRPDGSVWAHGTPFFGSWGKPGTPTAAPVEAIHFLSKTLENRLTSLSLRECFRRLCGVLCLRKVSPLAADRLLRFADRLAPLCRMLHFRPDPAIWSLLEGEIDDMETKIHDTPARL